MTKTDKLLANLTAATMVFLDDMNNGADDHSEERKKSGDYFRKSLSEAFAYLETNFPNRNQEAP